MPGTVLVSQLLAVQLELMVRWRLAVQKLLRFGLQVRKSSETQAWLAPPRPPLGVLSAWPDDRNMTANPVSPLLLLRL